MIVSREAQRKNFLCVARKRRFLRYINYIHNDSPPTVLNTLQGEVMEYAILAFSASKNETQREINLEPSNPKVTDAGYAQQIADAFAHRLNHNSFLNTQDWVGKIQAIDDPVPLPGYTG